MSEADRIDPGNPSAPQSLAVGRVLRPHGIRGDLLVEASNDFLQSLQPESELILGEQGATYSVVSIRPHQGRFLLKLRGCADRDQAEQFRGLEILIPADRIGPLPPGVYYHWQIIGLEVVELEGRSLGAVSEILETGGNDVYVVRSASGAELLLPAISSVILEIDLEKQRIRVAVPEGLEQSK